MSADFFSLMKYAATGQVSYEMTHYDKMRALAMAGGKIKTLAGVPPLSFKANGEPLISWSMKGNGSQSGTPTPDNPVTPEFVGVRTAQLYDENRRTVTSWALKTDTFIVGCYGNSKNMAPMNIESYNIGENEITVKSIAGGCGIGIIVKIESNRTYTLSFDTNKEITSSASYFGFNLIDNNGTLGTYEAPLATKVYTFNSGSANYAYFVFRVNPQFGEITYSNIMLNSGSTALAYEPFGWKVPITCAGQTTPIYTAEQETTRQIRKIAFDGTETGWQLFTASGVHQFYIDNALTSAAAVSGSSAVSNVAPYGATAANRASYQYGCYAVSSGAGIAFQMYGSASDFPDVAAWKAYLAEMSSAGTPVTAWYILAEEQTGIVNEPLCKIGAYADELHITDEVTIPTVKGQNTLTVDTNLPPSEMTITYTR